MSDAVVDPKVVPLASLLDELRKGKLRVPRFQRRFVWSGERVVKLLRSVRRRYPIGSLLVWRAGPGHACFNKVGPHDVPNPDDNPSEVGYLLDGHQRLSSLFGTLVEPPTRLRGEERAFAVYYDLDLQDFVRGDPTQKTHVPLWELMDNIPVLDRTQALMPTGEAATQEARLKWQAQARDLKAVSTAFQSYRIAVNEIQNAELDTAVNVFTLLNSTGVRISPAELFSALSWRVGVNVATSFDFAGTADAIREQFTTFDGLDSTTVLRCLLARLGEDIYSTEFSEIVKKHGSALTEEAKLVQVTIGRALVFLQKEWGVASNKALPYALQLVLLSEFFRLKEQPTESQRTEILRALWATSYNGSYTIGSSRTFNDAVESVRRFARGTALDLKDLGQGRARPLPQNFHPKSARVRAFFLFLKHQRPRRLDDGVEIPFEELLQRGLYDTALVIGSKTYSHRLANRVLLGQTAGAPIRDKLVLLWSRLSEPIVRDILRSHVISDEALLCLVEGQEDMFMEQRERDLREAERSFTSNTIQAEMSDERVENPELDADDDDIELS